AGGVGGYFDGLLAANGEDVTFIARGAHLRAIQKRGLQVKSTHGDIEVPNAHALENSADVGPVDVVMFGVKSWDTRTAGEAVRPLVGEDTAVISFQNGVRNEDELVEVLGPEAVV